MLKDLILQNGGATVKANGQPVDLKTGYQVSHRDLGVVAVEDFTEEKAQALLAQVSGRGEYAGFWVDNGKVYTDISRRHATKKEALQAGRELNQLAVWDWRNGRSLACA